MKQRVALLAKGFLMGSADVIPGVSGGTVALIVGIYERLISAIRHVDLTLVGALLQGRFWKHAVASLLGRTEPDRPVLDPVLARAESMAFLVTLFVGIATALVTGAKFIPKLLEEVPELMRALFFGLVLASVAVPWRRMGSRSIQHFLTMLLVGGATFWVVGLQTDSRHFAAGEVVVRRANTGAEATLPPGVRVQSAAAEHKYAVRYMTTTPAVMGVGVAEARVPVVATRAGEDGNVAPGHVTAFADGQAIPEGWTVAQSAALQGGVDPSLATIGISGAIAICAMILPGISGAFLLLILGQYGFILFQLHLALAERSPAALTIVGVFLFGIAVGILSFSRLLHWLLAHAHDITMAALVGLMVGSLRKLWPFQLVTPDGPVNVSPAAIGAEWLVPAAAFAVGFVVVVALERWGRRTTG